MAAPICSNSSDIVFFTFVFKINYFYVCRPKNGGLAQLARALAWQARGHRFESGILHGT